MLCTGTWKSAAIPVTGQKQWQVTGYTELEGIQADILYSPHPSPRNYLKK